ncbi:MAG: hypothetical protein GF349_01225 [Candidatus Magasanikbacteria bacterium]|nr:hypothetical protein [Candidatus Magasanikbacteria bacterium]
MTIQPKKVKAGQETRVKGPERIEVIFRKSNGCTEMGFSYTNGDEVGFFGRGNEELLQNCLNKHFLSPIETTFVIEQYRKNFPAG